MNEVDLITAIFDSHVAAGRTIDRLLEAGVPRDHITLLMAEDVHRNLNREIEEAGEPGAREAARAARTGAALGGALGLLAAAALSLTGIGIVAVGPLAALLGAGTVGATAGGLLGGLVGLGIRGDIARVYERDLGKGAVLLGVSVAPEDVERIEAILTAGGGRDFARIDRLT